MPSFDFTTADREDIAAGYNLFYFRKDRPYALTKSDEGLVFEARRGDGSLPADKPYMYKDRCEIGRVGFGEGQEKSLSLYRFRFRCLSSQQVSGLKFWAPRWWVLIQAHHGDTSRFPRGWPWQINVSSRPNELNFLYGLGDRPKRFPFPATWGEWQDIEIACRWSQGDDGMATVHHNGKNVAQASGPNMAHAVPRGMEVKHGIYRGNYVLGTDRVVFSHAGFS